MRQVEAQGPSRRLPGVQVAEGLCGGSLEHALLRVRGGGAGGAAASQGWSLHDLIFHLTGARISGLEGALGEGGQAAAAVEARRDGMSWMYRADASLAAHTRAAAAAPTAVARAAAEQRVRDAQDELDRASLRWQAIDAHTPGWVKQLCDHDRVAADAARLPAAERLYGGPARGRPCLHQSSHCGSACVTWASGRPPLRGRRRHVVPWRSQKHAVYTPVQRVSVLCDGDAVRVRVGVWRRVGTR